MRQPPAEPTGFVGRAAELEELTAALAAAVDGRGRMVLVGGEAGVGKTRLVGELAQRARDGGARVLSGRCIDLVGPGVPYLVLVDALHPVRDALPEVSRLARELDRPDEPDTARLRLFDGVRTLLEQLAAGAPLVLVLEDLHWADASTLDLVRYLADVTRGTRLLIVGTYRSEEAAAGGPLAHHLTDLISSRLAQVRDLDPLPREALRALLETAAAQPLPADLTDAIFRRSGGNPFYAEELLAAVARGEQALPHALRHALLARVAGLDRATEAVVRVVAAAGRDVSHPLVAEVTSLPEPDLRAALRTAVDRRILVGDQATGGFGFRHALLAEAIYAGLLPAEREQLHERIARALSDAATRRPDRTTVPELGELAELAEQWALAGRPRESLAASVRAARAAEAASGLGEALRHLERALELWEHVPDAERLAGLAQPAVLAWAAELADLTGRGRRAVQLVRRAIALLPADSAGSLFERLGTYLLPIGDREAGLAAFQRAVALAPAQPVATRARALAGLGNALMLAWRHADSRTVCEEAIELATAAGDDRAAVRAASVLGLDLCYLGDPAAGVARLVEARHRAHECGTPREVTQSYVLLCDLLIAAGRLVEAGRTAADGLAYARSAGLEQGYGVVLAGYAAEARIEIGEWDQAAELLDAALRHGAAYWTHYPHLLRAELAIGWGDFPGARRHLAAGRLAAAEPTSTPRHARLVAELELWQGRPLAALAALAPVDPAEANQHGPRLAALALRAAADARQLPPVPGQEIETAAETARRLYRRARQAQDRAAAVSARTPAWQAVAEGELSRLERRPDPAGWAAAVAAWDGHDHRYLGAYCRWRWAEALLAVGPPAGEAGVRVREAHRIASQLGAEPLRHELELLARRTRLDLVGLPADQRSRLAGALGLTPREGEVLSLLAQGYTNRDIATELTISAKTASVHVTHILRKLDVPNRHAAAAVAQRAATARGGPEP